MTRRSKQRKTKTVLIDSKETYIKKEKDMKIFVISREVNNGHYN